MGGGQDEAQEYLQSEREGPEFVTSEQVRVVMMNVNQAAAYWFCWAWVERVGQVRFCFRFGRRIDGWPGNPFLMPREATEIFARQITANSVIQPNAKIFVAVKNYFDEQAECYAVSLFELMYIGISHGWQCQQQLTSLPNDERIL